MARASIGWTPDVVLPRFREALAPGAVVAIVDVENIHGPYDDDVLAVIREHSEIEHHTDTRDLVEGLRGSGRFAIQGEERTDLMRFEQSVEDYIAFLHSTSTLARIRLGDRSAKIDEELRAVFARHGIGRLRYGVVGLVVWGRPQ